jgi:hypothetical protein
LFGEAAAIDALEKRSAGPDGARLVGTGYLLVAQETKDELAGLVIWWRSGELRRSRLRRRL